MNLDSSQCILRLSPKKCLNTQTSTETTTQKELNCSFLISSLVCLYFYYINENTILHVFVALHAVYHHTIERMLCSYIWHLCFSRFSIACSCSVCFSAVFDISWIQCTQNYWSCFGCFFFLSASLDVILVHLFICNIGCWLLSLCLLRFEKLHHQVI